MATNDAISTQSTFRLDLRMILLALVVVGLGVSGYLSYIKLSNAEVICTDAGSFNCGVVENSDYATLGGVYLGYLGFAAYIIIGGLLLLENRIAFLREYAPMLVLVMVFFGWIFSMWLVYVQGFILEAWCMWCLMHEVNITVMLVLSGLRWKQALDS